MKRFMTFIANLIRLAGGLLAVLIMLAGLSAALKELWDWVRRKRMDRTFVS